MMVSQQGLRSRHKLVGEARRGGKSRKNRAEIG